MLPSIVIVTFAEESDAILLAIDPVSRVYPWPDYTPILYTL